MIKKIIRKAVLEIINEREDKLEKIGPLYKKRKEFESFLTWSESQNQKTKEEQNPKKKGAIQNYSGLIKKDDN